MIQDGSKVSIHYTLKVDGAVVDSSTDKEPLEYEHGAGQIIPGLESELTGLAEGDHKEVTVSPEEAYGPVNADAIQKIPSSAFSDPEGLEVGGMVSGRTQGGQPFQAKVVEVDSGFVTLDLNHPLAGKTLQFSVEVVRVG